MTRTKLQSTSNKNASVHAKTKSGDRPPRPSVGMAKKLNKDKDKMVKIPKEEDPQKRKKRKRRNHRKKVANDIREAQKIYTPLSRHAPTERAIRDATKTEKHGDQARLQRNIVILVLEAAERFTMDKIKDAALACAHDKGRKTMKKRDMELVMRMSPHSPRVIKY